MSNYYPFNSTGRPFLTSLFLLNLIPNLPDLVRISSNSSHLSRQIESSFFTYLFFFIFFFETKNVTCSTDRSIKNYHIDSQVSQSRQTYYLNAVILFTLIFVSSQSSSRNFFYTKGPHPYKISLSAVEFHIITPSSSLRIFLRKEYVFSVSRRT